MITIYADGACSGNPGPAGSAIVMLRPENNALIEIGTQWRALGHATNQVAELVAALMAIEAANASTETEFLVRCDSEYVVKGIKEWMPNWIVNGWRTTSKKPVANLEHWKNINAALKIASANGKTIRLDWVKGHSIDVFNNRVDALAVYASRRPVGATSAEPATTSPASAASVTEPLNALGLTQDQWDKLCATLIQHARGEAGNHPENPDDDRKDTAELGARRALLHLLSELENAR